MTEEVEAMRAVRLLRLGVVCLLIAAVAAVVWGGVELRGVEPEGLARAYAPVAPVTNGVWGEEITAQTAMDYDFREKAYNSANNGSADKPYIIMTADDLAFLGYLTTTEPSNYTGKKYYRLGADINLGDDGSGNIKAWKPIGVNPTNLTKPFMGAIDGGKRNASGELVGRYRIKGLTVVESSANVGLIGFSRGLNTFTNLILEDVYVLGRGNNIGALAGQIRVEGAVTGGDYKGDITLSNISVEGNSAVVNELESASYTGGLVGDVYVANGSLTAGELVNRAEIWTAGNYGGGIFGCTEVSSYAENDRLNLSGSVNYGMVTAKSRAAGIVALAEYISLNNCRNEGNIVSEVDNLYAGGLVAHTKYGVNIFNSRNEGSVEGGFAAGLLGKADTVVDRDCVVENSYNTGTVTSRARTAGLIGEFYVADGRTLIVKDSYNTGEINTLSGDTAGIIGRAQGNVTLSRVYNTASAGYDSGVANYYAGGLIAYYINRNNATLGINSTLKIEHSYNLGDMAVSSAPYSGGLVGYAEQTSAVAQPDVIITDSYNLGNVEALTYAGGLVGYMRARLTVERSFNKGDITALTYTGGFVGYMIGTVGEAETQTNLGSITKSYNSGNIISGSEAGGLFGRLTYSGAGQGALGITNSINTGEVFNGTSSGGMVGYLVATNLQSRLNINNSFSRYVHLEGEQLLVGRYSDNDASRIVFSGGSRALNDSELKDQSIYTAAGFGFGADGEWAMPEADGNAGAPYLKVYSATVTFAGGHEGTVEYRAVIGEKVVRYAYRAGQEFLGWGLDGVTVKYGAGEQIPVSNLDMRLEAVFEQVLYYRVDVSNGAGSVAAQYIAQYSGGRVDDFAYGFLPGAQGRFEVVLVDENNADFTGWEIFKHAQGGGSWYKRTNEHQKVFDIAEFARSVNIADYAVPSDELIDGTYRLQGIIQIRAGKNVRTAAARLAFEVDSGTEDGVGKLSVGLQGMGEPSVRNYNETIPNIADGSVLELQASIDVNRPETKHSVIESVIVKYDYSIKLSNVYESASWTAPTVTANNGIAVVTVVFPSDAAPDKDVSITITAVYGLKSYQITARALTVGGYIPQHNGLVSINGSGSLRLGDNINLSDIINKLEGGQSDAIGYKYTYDRYELSRGDGSYGATAESLTADINFVENYVVDGKIEVIIRYRAEYKVSIEAQDGGSLNITVNTPDEGIKPYINGGWYKERTSFDIVAAAADYHSFEGFYSGDVRLGGSALDYYVAAIEGAVSIQARFQSQIYVLNATARGVSGNIVTGAKLGLLVNGAKNVDRIKAGDVITVDYVEVPAGYRQSIVIITKGSTTEKHKPIEPGTAYTVTESDFEHILSVSGQITVSVVLVKQYSLNVIVPEGSGAMGGYTVYVEKHVENRVVYEVTEERLFDQGAKVRIEVAAREHYLFGGFENVSAYERVDSNPNIVDIILIGSDRTVGIKFRAVSYTIEPDNAISGEGLVTVTKQNFSVGEEVVIILTPASGKVIKSWTINGADVRSLAAADGVFADNTLTLKMSAEWVSKYGGVLESEVVFATNPGLVAMTVIISVTVPLLGCAFVFLFVQNARKKRIIRGELKDAEMAKYKLDTSAYITDIIEGKNVGEITDEQVKSEIRRRKGKGGD